MATLQDIEQAIRNADAAGDGDAVRKLAAARQAILAQPQQQNSGPSFDSPEARAMTARNAAMGGMQEDDNTNAVQADRNAVVARGVESGIPEGVKSLWGGIKQLAGGVQDVYNTLVKGQPSRSEDTLTMPDGTVKRVHEMLDSSKEKQAIAQEMIRAQVDEEKAVDAGIPRQGRRAVAGATALAGASVLPEVALPGKATTMTGAVVRNAVTGTAGNAMMFDADGSSMGSAALAAGAPALLSTVTGLVPAVKNWVGRAMQRTLAAGNTDARAANFAATMPKTAKTATLAQRTGVPELITLERSAQNSEMVNHFADQTDKFVAETVDLLRKPVKEGQTLANDFVRTKALAADNLKNFKIASSDNYAAGIAEAKRIASEGAAGNVIPVKNFEQKANELFAESRGRVERGQKGNFSPKSMDYIEDIFTKNGKDRARLNTQQLTDLLSDLTSRQRDQGLSALQRKKAGELRAALDNDLDDIEKTGSFEADDAVKTILETRAEYRRAQTLIGELGDSAAYKLMGIGEREAVAPEQLLSRYKSFSGDKQKEVRDFLESNSPDMLNTMKNAVVDEASAHARTIRGAADSQQNLDQMVDTMFDAKKGFDMRTGGLWNADELKTIDGIKDGLRTIANHRPGASSSGTPIKAEDVAINAVSQHPAFLARQLARVIMATKGSKFFTDPQILDRMRVINRSTTGSATDLIARAALLDYLNTNYAETQEAKQ